MSTFKHLCIPLLSTLVLSSAACRDRDDQRTSYKPVEVETDRDRTVTPPAVETRDSDDTFVVTRDRDTSELRVRLSRLDDRIAELRARGDEKATELANSLRVRRDQLAARLDRAGDETSSGWDSFKRDVNDTFDKLEDEIDAAF